MDKEHICQSCGRVMSAPSMYGTHGDGHRNEDYCIHCYKDGFFTCHSIEEQLEASTGSLSNVDLKTLKRWMGVEDKASWVLDRCGYVTLSTIDEGGYPRPIAIDVIAHESIRELWMTSFRSSNKVAHLRKNPKAGISFVREADSVTLIGTADIFTDSETLNSLWKDIFYHYYPAGPADEGYCLIRFTTLKARLWLDSELSTLDFTQ